jgi:hypothetical protein
LLSKYNFGSGIFCAVRPEKLEVDSSHTKRFSPVCLLERLKVLEELAKKSEAEALGQFVYR